MDQQPESQEFRFARAVSPTASKPGHHLATACFELGNEACTAYIIEAYRNDMVSLRGMATNFKRTRLFSHSVRGPLIERLKEIHDTPQEPELTIRLEMLEGGASPSQFDVQEARVIFSGVRGPNGIDADAAIAQLKMRGDRPQGDGPPEEGPWVCAWLTNLRRGWICALVVAVFVTSLRFILEPDAADGTVLNRGVEIVLSPGSRPFRVDGLLQLGSSITGAPSIMG